MTFTLAQQKAIAILPKFSALASICGSSCIITEVVFLDRRKLKRVYHRLLLTMSMYDVIESSWNFASSWPIPEGTPGVAFATGNTRTCVAQGFVLQFGLAIPILNMCLSIYYVLVIQYSWSETDIRTRAEPWFHAASLSIALSTCFAGLALDLFNNSNLWCWIAPLPLDCKDTYTYGDEEGNCVRGNNAWIYRWAFYYAELWFCILFVMFAMASVYVTVRNLEKANDKYLKAHHRRAACDSSTGSSHSGRRHSKSKSLSVAWQALWYVGAFYLTFLFATINRLVQQIASKTYFPLILIHAILEPCQGFFNYIVYIRPRYLKHRETNPEKSHGQTLRYIFSRDEDRIRSRRDSMYVDDDHEDEEEAKRELARWRMKINPRELSGIFRFLGEFSSSGRFSLTGSFRSNASGSHRGRKRSSSSRRSSSLEERIRKVPRSSDDTAHMSETERSRRSCDEEDGDGKFLEGGGVDGPSSRATREQEERTLRLTAKAWTASTDHRRENNKGRRQGILRHSNGKRRTRRGRDSRGSGLLRFIPGMRCSDSDVTTTPQGAEKEEGDGCSTEDGDFCNSKRISFHPDTTFSGPLEAISEAGESDGSSDKGEPISPVISVEFPISLEETFAEEFRKSEGSPLERRGVPASPSASVAIPANGVGASSHVGDLEGSLSDMGEPISLLASDEFHDADSAEETFEDCKSLEGSSDSVGGEPISSSPVVPVEIPTGAQ